MKRVCSRCGNYISDTSKQFNRFCCPKCGTTIEKLDEREEGALGFSRWRY